MRPDNKKRLFEVMKKINPDFNQKNVYYHGSNNRFNEFNLNNDNKTYHEIDLPVWFFTKDFNYAKSYGKYLYIVELNIHKTFNLSNKNHYELFIRYLKEVEGKTNNEINDILDEETYNELPYWTCDDAYYTAISNNFDSILIQEELEKEVISVGVFNMENIKIIDIK